MASSRRTSKPHKTPLVKTMDSLRVPSKEAPEYRVSNERGLPKTERPRHPFEKHLGGWTPSLRFRSSIDRDDVVDGKRTKFARSFHHAISSPDGQLTTQAVACVGKAVDHSTIA